MEKTWKIYCASHIHVGREKSVNSTKHEFSIVLVCFQS